MEPPVRVLSVHQRPGPSPRAPSPRAPSLRAPRLHAPACPLLRCSSHPLGYSHVQLCGSKQPSGDLCPYTLVPMSSPGGAAPLSCQRLRDSVTHRCSASCPQNLHQPPSGSQEAPGVAARSAARYRVLVQTRKAAGSADGLGSRSGPGESSSRAPRGRQCGGRVWSWSRAGLPLPRVCGRVANLCVPCSHVATWVPISRQHLDPMVFTATTIQCDPHNRL